MSISLVRGAEAELLLAAAPFRAGWAAVHQACPWATAFQSSEFGIAWYQIYRSRFEPLLLLGRDTSGDLNAVLPLAICKETSEVIPAGAHQAEYQGWICLPELAQTFPPRAFALLQGQFPSAEVRFRYLPAGIPLEWTGSDQGRNSTVMKSFRRPLMRLGDGTEVRQSLQKSGNRSRLRQMRKIGAVEFVRVTDPADFETLLDQISVCHDCRQLAIHGTAPFLEDDLKRAFHLAMLNAPGLLHATVLKVGGQLASFHLNVTRGKELQLYLIAHNPRFAKFSPGKLHMLFLARMLQEEGFERIDLTPGGDEYKERFANDGDHVQRLTVHPTPVHRLKGLAANRIEEEARKLLGRFDLTPADIRCSWADCGPRRILALATGQAARWLRQLHSTRQIRVYSCETAAALTAADDIHRDDLHHLLSYQPAACEPSRRQFLSRAMRRFEDGQHVYTHLASNRLLTFGWLLDEPSEQWAAEILPGFDVPAGSAMVLDFWLPIDSAERRLAGQSLGMMVRDAAASGARRVFVALPHQRGSDEPFLKEMGFVYEGALVSRTHMRRSRVLAEVVRPGKARPSEAPRESAKPATSTAPLSSRLFCEPPRRKTA